MKNIMFDLYGTLVDIHTDEESDRFWKKIVKKINEAHAFQFEALKAQYKKLCFEKEQIKEEIDIVEVFEDLFHVDRQRANEIALEFRQISTRRIRLYPGVRKLIYVLEKEGYSLYLLSNAQESFTMRELKLLNLIQHFKGIALSSMYSVKKPNKEFYRRAMKNFSIVDALMIGNDVTCDILPAKELGLKTIYIESNLSPYSSYEDKVKRFNFSKLYQQIHQFD